MSISPHVGQPTEPMSLPSIRKRATCPDRWDFDAGFEPAIGLCEETLSFEATEV